jgi:hypothetical protein
MKYLPEIIEKSIGEVFVNNVSKGHCLYEFSYIPQNPNKMKITINNPPFGPSDAFNSHTNNNLTAIKIVKQTEGEKKIFLLSNNIGYSNSNSVALFKAKVEEYLIEEENQNVDEKDYTLLVYEIPLISISHENGCIIRHVDYGYIHGSYDWVKDKIELKRDFFIIKSKYCDIKLADYYSFLDGTNTNYYYKIDIIKKTHLVIKTKDDSKIDAIRGTVEIVMKIISLIERNRINWNSELIQYNKNDKTVSYEKYRWASPPTKDYSARLPNIKEKRETLQSILSAYEICDPETKQKFDKVAGFFQVAITAYAIEDQLLRWHSVLDYFINLFNYKEKPFSTCLVKLCDDRNVQIDDLFNPELINNIRDGSKDGAYSTLPCTKYRNMFVHRGFDSFEGIYDKVTKEVNNMRSLAERILLNMINVDYKQTMLGKR